MDNLDPLDSNYPNFNYPQTDPDIDWDWILGALTLAALAGVLLSF